MTPRAAQLRRRIRWFIWLFIFGLVFSGVTAIPTVMEVDALVRTTGAQERVASAPTPEAAPAWAVWLVNTQTALHDTQDHHPVLFYGTDWLAFGHFVIAMVFIGVLRNPVRNRWLFDFGLLACALVIPYAMIFGAVRGIPVWWRLIDCSFGVLGAIPLWLCRRWTKEIEAGGHHH